MRSDYKDASRSRISSATSVPPRRTPHFPLQTEESLRKSVSRTSSRCLSRRGHTHDGSARARQNHAESADYEPLHASVVEAQAARVEFTRACYRSGMRMTRRRVAIVAAAIFAGV